MEMHFHGGFHAYIYIPRNALGSDAENKTSNTRYGLCLFYNYHTDRLNQYFERFDPVTVNREDRVESSCLYPGQDKY